MDERTNKPSDNRNLSAAEQQLKAVNEQLKATNQQLRASQQLNLQFARPGHSKYKVVDI